MSSPAEEVFLNALDPDRRAILSQFRQIILEQDPTVVETVAPLMGQQTLTYEADGIFKYALASTKAHLSFHSLVMYGCPPLREKFVELLPHAKFQKGCINFKSLFELPLENFRALISESARIEWPPKAYAERLKKKQSKPRK